MTLIYVACALSVISILIFIHEAGHFFAAKRVGVRVERFAIGFDPTVRGRPLRFFSFRRGETEYVLGMVPFGGYVKLAGGEMLLDPTYKPAPDELPGKSVGARAFVFVAGSVMNIVTAVLLFITAFSLGVEFREPRVGGVEPGGPAWEAGIRAGDSIIEIDGDAAIDFNDMQVSVALSSPDNPMKLLLERPRNQEAPERLEVLVTPRKNDERGLREIGIYQDYSRTLGTPRPGSPAALAGARAGDRLVSVVLRGERLPPQTPARILDALATFLSVRPGESFRLVLEREGTELELEVQPRLKAESSLRKQMGILQKGGVRVGGVRAESTASRALRKGDVLLAWNGHKPVPVHWLTLLDETLTPGPEVELALVDAAGEKRRERLSRSDLLRWITEQDVYWDEPVCCVGALPAGEAAGGLEPGDVLLSVEGRLVLSPDDVRTIARAAASARLAVKALRGDDVVSLPGISRELLAGGGRVTWRAMPRILAVTAGGPAARAGVEPGSRISSIGGATVDSWEGMLVALQGIADGGTTEIGWMSPSGESRKASITVGIGEPVDLGLNVSDLKREVRVSIIDAPALGLKRTVMVTQSMFLILKSLLRREVSPRNLSGPIGITHLLTKVTEKYDFGTILYWLALISLNLGVLNLLPFPILDGGHLLFLGIEKVKGSPVSPRVQEWAMNVAFIGILVLFLFVTFHDIKRLLG